MDILADQIVPLPAEQPLRLGVHEDAAPLGIGGDDAFSERIRQAVQGTGCFPG